MPLTDKDNVNAYLPQDKISVDDTTVVPVAVQAERVVKAYLAGIYTPTTLASWTDPDTNVPQIIVDIASKLAACFFYRRAYSEDIPDLSDDNYAQELYKEAMMMIADIRTGTIVLTEVPITEVNTSIEFTTDDFIPNDSTTPGPVFTMSQEF